jgi:KaiC/GvpD/RAD55 family RecA-like ATPase
MQGEEGVGKSTFVYQFAAEGLQQGESVLLITTDMTTYQVQQEMRYWHIPVDDMLRTRHFAILDTHPILGKEYVSLGDIERLLYDIMRHQQAMPLPCRVIIDSIIPLALQYTAHDFLSFIEQKNHLLRLPDVVLMDVIMPGVLNEHLSYSLRNHYDAVLDICMAEGEASRHNGHEQRVLRVNKARGMNVHVHSFPYVLRPGEGVILHTGAPDSEREPS